MIYIDIIDGANPENELKTFELPLSNNDIRDIYDRLSSCKKEKLIVSAYTDLEELNDFLAYEKIAWEDIPKLNALAAMMLCLDDNQLNNFGALIYEKEPRSMEELAFIMTQSDNISPDSFYSKHDLGKYLVDEGLIDIPKAMREFISYKKIGGYYLENVPCLPPLDMLADDTTERAICLKCQGKELIETAIESVNDYFDNAVFNVHIAKTNCLTATDETIEDNLPLPAEYDKLNKFIGKIDNSYEIESISCRDSIFNGKFNVETNLYMLNSLAFLLKEMSDIVFLKHKAILYYLGFLSDSDENSQIPLTNHDLSEMLNKAVTTNKFVFISKAADDYKAYENISNRNHTPYGIVFEKNN